MRWLAFLSVICFGVAVVLFSDANSGTHLKTANVRGTFTYGEAKQLGLATPPLPSQVGLPPCHPDPNWPGFTSEDDTRSIPNDAPSCASDPRKSMYSVEVANPAPGIPP